MANPDIESLTELGPSICIVDDTADYRFLLQQIFSCFYPVYSVNCFANGQVFLDELPQLSPKPSLILLDRHMPELDGHQTLLKLKEPGAYKIIPVVMMSAEASAIEIKGCYDAGVNSFVIKPPDFNSLKAMIDSICQYWFEINLSLTE